MAEQLHCGRSYLHDAHLWDASRIKSDGTILDSARCLCSGQVETEPNACPAYPVNYAPHQWMPVTAVGAPLQASVDGEPIMVLEVCKSCKQYRTREYHLVPRDQDGVH